MKEYEALHETFMKNAMEYLDNIPVCMENTDEGTFNKYKDGTVKMVGGTAKQMQEWYKKQGKCEREKCIKNTMR